MSNILKFKKKREKKLKHVDFLIPTVQNINGVEVPSYAINNRHIEEWKTKRTIDGKKVTSNLAKEIDCILKFIDENQDKFIHD